IGSIGLSVSRRTRPLAYCTGIALTANVLANFALIPPLGAKGAAIATPIGWGVYLAAIRVAARSHARWRFPYTTLLRTALARGAPYAAATLAIPDGLPRLSIIVVKVVLVAALYVLALWALGERRASAPVAAA